MKNLFLWRSVICCFFISCTALAVKKDLQNECRPLSELHALPQNLQNLLLPWLPTIKSMEPPSRLVSSFESFAGLHELTSGVEDEGMLAVCYDKSYTPLHDVLLKSGFTTQLEGLLKVRKFGLCWGAPVCSSWIYWKKTNEAFF